MNAYNSQRVGAAAVALGIADGACRRALAYVGEREQFGRPLAEFQGLQWMLADMSIRIAAARLMIHKAAASAAPFPDVTLAAQAKIFASEMAHRGDQRRAPVLRGARLLAQPAAGAHGPRRRMFTIGGGTAQILRTVVASRILGRKLPQTRDGFSRLAANG